MERLERFYRIDRLLKPGRPVSTARLLADLEISAATLKRDLEYMRDRMSAPIEWDRRGRGYRYSTVEGSGAFSLPGFWLSAGEIHSLLVMRALLSNLGPGLLAPLIDPFVQRMERVVAAAGQDFSVITRRIRVIGPDARRPEPAHFSDLARAVLDRKRVNVTHYNRSSNITTAREISPQRLIRYRGSWYVDAWCHMRRGVRSFSLDALLSTDLLEIEAMDVPDEVLDRLLTSSYGIFSGEPTATAVLRFSPVRARWVSLQKWHPDQKSHFDADGSFVLQVPYSDDRELLREILRHGADVEVVAPVELRTRLAEEVTRIAGKYE